MANNVHVVIGRIAPDVVYYHEKMLDAKRMNTVSQIVSANVLLSSYWCVSDSGVDLVISDPVIKAREVFISDVTDTYPVSALR